MSTLLKPGPSELAESTVLTKAALRAAERLQIPASQLSGIIGVSEAGISRMRNEKLALEPGSKPFEIALLFVRLFRALDAVTGGDDKVSAAWLRNLNLTLGEQPLNRMRSLSGLFDVLAYLDARRAVV
jgi:Protein of unknown function (DUF2384)